ncbi:endonuclease III [Alkalispirochaeta alkalica]|uniref:endonuclease III n=1 Tax=Alkalispirochaeta alkalica TaxID=46356 RepID=UPI00037D0546|nr:endonuclease III [Alkalispirochaeta alkalica]
MDLSSERFLKILDILEEEYRETPSMLDYRSPFELLIAVILSAQTTDEQVNAILPALFGRFPTPRELAAAPQEEVEGLIHSVGFFRRKSQSIIGAARHLLNYHEGMVPDSMESLVKIPGVGRKSAGVVLLHIYGEPAIIVDTHFGRVVRRLGFSRALDPVRIERDVAEVLPRQHWNAASMRLNYHGRRFCFSRKPACDGCPLAGLCPSRGEGSAAGEGQGEPS